MFVPIECDWPMLNCSEQSADSAWAHGSVTPMPRCRPSSVPSWRTSSRPATQKASRRQLNPAAQVVMLRFRESS
ncbi:unnamed protein product [Protopolystoma xenopodis]|uniref:Uncharacterized protein n=1 Tax=Protopolystoma xenopodis TaxID=117903 RepID=A0A448X922_9PLAT|nr:unnamed protein product [Protopolystoma xenopodis]